MREAVDANPGILYQRGTPADDEAGVDFYVLVGDTLIEIDTKSDRDYVKSQQYADERDGDYHITGRGDQVIMWPGISREEMEDRMIPTSAMVDKVVEAKISELLEISEKFSMPIEPIRRTLGRTALENQQE